MLICLFILFLVSCVPLGLKANPLYEDLPVDTLIVGGVEATPHEFPWQVSIRTNLNNFHLCGGVVLDQRTVLTTAACAERFSPYMSTVAVGKHNLTAEESEYRQISQVTSIHLHPDYPGDTDYSNDIAIIKTNPGFTWTDYVKPICKLHDSDSISEEYGVISGWGTQREEHISLPDNLRKTTVKIIRNNDDCQLLVGSELTIEDSMICITSPNPSVPIDSCSGDEGGPLVTREGNNGTVVLTGLISFGIGCGRQSMPSFCTRISPYIEFIQRYLES